MLLEPYLLYSPHDSKELITRSSTLTGGALTVASDAEFEDEPSRILKLTGVGNSLTGDVTLTQVRVLAESAGSLGGGNLFLDNATVEPSCYDYKKRFSGLEYYDWEGRWVPIADLRA